MKPSDVYLRAAERVCNRLDTYSCCAISSARCEGGGGYWDDCRERIAYVAAFSRDDAAALQKSFNRCVNDREVRVLALLFMHQIALDEERRA